MAVLKSKKLPGYQFLCSLQSQPSSTATCHPTAMPMRKENVTITVSMGKDNEMVMFTKVAR